MVAYQLFQTIFEFHNHSTWRQTQTIALSTCLLGTMVFPKDEGKEIDTRVVMVVNAMFRGIGRKSEEKKYCCLAPVILADIYRSLSLCKNGFPFFQGCNILLQWWLTKHLCKRDNPSHRSWPNRVKQVLLIITSSIWVFANFQFTPPGMRGQRYFMIWKKETYSGCCRASSPRW